MWTLFWGGRTTRGSQAWGCCVLKFHMDIDLGRTNYTEEAGIGQQCVEALYVESAAPLRGDAARSATR